MLASAVLFPMLLPPAGLSHVDVIRQTRFEALEQAERAGTHGYIADQLIGQKGEGAMLDLGGVEVGPDQLAGIGFGEREDGALDGGSLGEAADGGEGIAVVVVTRRVFAVGGIRAVDAGDELGRGGVDGAAEGFQRSRLFTGSSG
jgi:hypothetical protein